MRRFIAVVWLVLGVGSVGCGGPSGPADSGGSLDGTVADGSAGGDTGTTVDRGDAGALEGDAGSAGDGALERDAGPEQDAGEDFEVPVQEDRDGDGLPDSEDPFPDNAGEMFDDDKDGIGNVADLDEDGDGVGDGDDALPFDATRSSLSTISEVEPNNLYRLATPVAGALPLRLGGTFAPVTDIDRFSLTLPRGAAVSFALSGGGSLDEVSLELWRTKDIPLQTLTSRPAPGGLALASALIPADGDYVLVLSASGQGAGLAYTLDAFVDSDLDGLSDDVERARGLHPGRPDTDGDGIPDRFEAALAKDPDSDGLPSWLDSDSDGDGISDRVEGALDDDHDGTPSFLDLDADGDGVLDAQEPGAGGQEAPDTDADGRPDFRDVDDDGDGLLDVNDAKPKVAALSSGAGATDLLEITSAHTELAGGHVAPAAAIEGETLVIVGRNFDPAPGGNVVVLDGGARTLNLTPAAATATELRLTVPSGAGGRLAVAVGDRVSSAFELTALRPTDPVLFRATGAVVYESTFTLEGRNLGGVVAASFGGGNAQVSYATPTTVVGTVPWEVNSRREEWIRVALGRRWSNRIPLTAKMLRSLTVQLPAGSAIDPATLTYSAEDGVDTVSGTDRLIGASEERPVLIAALAPLGAAGARCLVLQGHTFPGDWQNTLTTTTAAVSMALVATQVVPRLAPESRVLARDALAVLPETAAYAAELDRALLADPCALATGTDAGLKAALVDLMVAAEAWVDAGLSSGTLQRARSLAGPIITPVEASDVLLRSIDGGNIEIENDTSLLLSAKFTESASQRVLAPHVRSYYDLEILGGQYGLLAGFWASTKEFSAPQYRNAKVEVVTPGVVGAPPSTLDASDAQHYVRVRTVADRIIIPIFGAVLGERALVKRNLIVSLIVQHIYDAVQDFRAAFAAGDVKSAVAILINALIRDLEGAGPLTRAIAQLVADATPNVVAEVAAGIGARAVPLFGQVKFAVEAIDKIATATNVTKCIVDCLFTPQVLPFDVDYGFEIGKVEPAQVEREYRAVTLRVQGVGFRRYDPVTGDPARPQVTVTDTGGRVPPLGPLAERLSYDGTSFEVELPASFVARARGPLLLKVKILADEKPAPYPIVVTKGLQLDSIDPPASGPGDKITLHGSHFGIDAREARVWFHGLDPAGKPVVHRGATLAVDRTRLEATVPGGVLAGQAWSVDVEIGPPGNTFTSNQRPFNVQFQSLAGDWHFTFTADTCYDSAFQVYETESHWEEVDPAVVNPIWGTSPGDTYRDLSTQFGRPMKSCGNVSAHWITSPADPHYGMVSLSSQSSGIIGCREAGGYVGVLSPDGKTLRGQEVLGFAGFNCLSYAWPPESVVGRRK